MGTKQASRSSTAMAPSAGPTTVALINIVREYLDALCYAAFFLRRVHQRAQF